MLIGIDASRATKTKFKTGTEHYTEKIILSLVEIDKKNDYILYSPVDPKDKLANLPKNFQYKIMPFPRLWSQIRLSWEFLTNHEKPDVFFEPAHTIPIIHHPKTVVTLHDLGFKYFPELYTPFERHYHNWCMDFSVKHAFHIITPSLYTKKDIVTNYGLNPKKITVIYHGYDQEIYKPRIYPKTTKERPYIFFVGRLEQKKNILGILKSYELLRREPSINHKLVLAGKPGYGYEQIKEYKLALPDQIKNDIVELGYVKDKELESWMKNADIFFFPSFFEGFGIPVIEAMACGIPVVCSNSTSLPEIVGSAAIQVNPQKHFEMAVVLSRLIHDTKLRKAMISKGKVRASLYSWHKAAWQTLKVLEEIAKS